MRVQPVSGRQRLGLDGVERRARDAPVVERFAQRVLIDQRAARDVDEVTPRLDVGEASRSNSCRASPASPARRSRRDRRVATSSARSARARPRRRGAGAPVRRRRARACRTAARALATALPIAPRPTSPSVLPCRPPSSRAVPALAAARVNPGLGQALLEGEHHGEHPLRDRHRARAARAGEQSVAHAGAAESRRRRCRRYGSTRPRARAPREIRRSPRERQQDLAVHVFSQVAVAGNPDELRLGNDGTYALESLDLEVREHADRSLRLRGHPYPPLPAASCLSGALCWLARLSLVRQLA